MKKSKYKISHIKILKMIKKGKLEENTRIYASDCPEAFIWKNGTLYFHGEPANFKMFIENIKYAKFKIVKVEDIIRKQLINIGSKAINDLKDSDN